MITAFLPEAQPFIDYFGLVKTCRVNGYRVFFSRDVIVGVCGQGQQHAANITRQLIARSNEISGFIKRSWLNFGISGSRSFEMGKLVFAEAVLDSNSGTTWQLPALTGNTYDSAMVETVISPAGVYESGILYDMEAAGMVSELSEHGMLDQAMIAKLISDGPLNPVQHLKIRTIRALLDRSRPKIIRLIDYVSESR